MYVYMYIVFSTYHVTLPTTPNGLYYKYTCMYIVCMPVCLRVEYVLTIMYVYVCPYSVAIEALQKFLACTESSVMIERLEQQNSWTLLEKEETCAHGMLILARALAEEHWDLVQPTVETLGANLMSVYDSHRITVVAFYSEVLVFHACT